MLVHSGSVSVCWIWTCRISLSDAADGAENQELSSDESSSDESSSDESSKNDCNALSPMSGFLSVISSAYSHYPELPTELWFGVDNQSLGLSHPKCRRDVGASSTLTKWNIIFRSFILICFAGLKPLVLFQFRLHSYWCTGEWHGMSVAFIFTVTAVSFRICFFFFRILNSIMEVMEVWTIWAKEKLRAALSHNVLKWHYDVGKPLLFIVVSKEHIPTQRGTAIESCMILQFNIHGFISVCNVNDTGIRFILRIRHSNSNYIVLLYICRYVAVLCATDILNWIFIHPRLDCEKSMKFEV